MAADEVNLPANAEVIGVEIEGKSYAFSLSAMNGETKHVLNLHANETPFSVTYCPLADCVRVVATEGPDLIPLKMVGLNEDGLLVLLLDGERDDMDSLDLPLKDFAHQRTTFGKWKKAHVKSQVFVAPAHRKLRNALRS